MVLKIFKNEKNDQVKDRKKNKTKNSAIQNQYEAIDESNRKNVEPITYSYQKKLQSYE